MAPLSSALRVSLSCNTPNVHSESSTSTNFGGKGEERKEGDEVVYDAVLDPEWTVAINPSGGYLLSLILSAALSFMASTSTPDPLHLTGTFLKPGKIKKGVESKVEVRLKVVRKTGKMCWLEGGMWQEGIMLLPSTLLFTLLPSPSPPYGPPTPPFPTYSPPMPLKIHPSQVTKTITHPMYNFKRRLTFYELDENNPPGEKVVQEEVNVQDSLTKGTEFGAWVVLEEGEKVTEHVVPVICDLTHNTPSKIVRNLQPSWFATLLLSISFTYPLRALPASSRVGVYSYGRTVRAGVHDQVLEVWSDPFAGTDGEEDGGAETWRKRSVLVATGSQVATTVPLPPGAVDPVKWNEERRRREKERKEQEREKARL
ncbi:hypothetical protein BT69DRAFT_1281580 [Atractiella rhizophila]|nr:hypothetical protein BT69DRAFT_1281580 [Atractiella rhizophila]